MSDHVEAVSGCVSCYHTYGNFRGVSFHFYMGDIKITKIYT